MTASMARTIVLPVSRPLWKRLDGIFPPAQPGCDLDYSIDVTALLADVGDILAAISLAIAPSGSGELAALDLAVNGSVITAQFGGGVAGRVYRIAVTAMGASGRVWTWHFGLTVGRPSELCPPPPNPGFGMPITFCTGVPVFGSTSVATGLVGTGTNQATALPLLAQTNIIASVPSGSGFILPAVGFASGTVIVQNRDPADAAPIYPPAGAQIEDLGVNVPFIVGADGSRISFTTQSPQTQWYAG
jgi:hypothetical protein